MSDNPNPPVEPTPAIEETAEFQPPVSEQQFYAQLEDFDALEDLPSVWAGYDKLAPSPNFKPLLSGVDPETQTALKERGRELNPSDPDAGAQTALLQHLQREAINTRVRSMPDDATHYQKEVAAIELELYRAEERSMEIAAQLGQRRTVVDPVTGKTIETEDPLLPPERREALGQELNSLLYRSTLLVDQERPRRLAEAKKKDWDAYQDTQRALFEAAEVDRRAKKLAAEARIDKQAEARARARYGLGKE